MWRTFDSFVHGDGVKTRNALLTYDSHPHETKESSPKPAFSPNTKRRTWVNKQVPAGNQTCLITERYHQQKSSPSGNPNKIHKNPLTARFPSGFQGTRSRWDRWGVAQATRCSHREDYGSAPWNRSSWAGNRGGTDIWSWQKTCEKRSKQ